MMLGDLPPLDCHAHVAPDVTQGQIAALGGAVVVAVTTKLDDAEAVTRRDDPSLVWGCGIHPEAVAKGEQYDEERFKELVDQFAVIGEIGLDRRSGKPKSQEDVLSSILRIVQDQPVILSLHSAGRVDEVLNLLERYPQRGPILHWFLGNAEAVTRATKLGCFFSVNAAMSDEVLSRIPLEQMLPETDYPATKRRAGVRVPADVIGLEERVASIVGFGTEELRRQWYRNLRRLSSDSGALDRFPEWLADLVLTA